MWIEDWWAQARRANAVAVSFLSDRAKQLSWEFKRLTFLERPLFGHALLR